MDPDLESVLIWIRIRAFAHNIIDFEKGGKYFLLNDVWIILQETIHFYMLALVPFPALFYILTARFTDPYRINAIYDVN